jgi:hypothetical protein
MNSLEQLRSSGDYINIHVLLLPEILCSLYFFRRLSLIIYKHSEFVIFKKNIKYISTNTPNNDTRKLLVMKCTDISPIHVFLRVKQKFNMNMVHKIINN